jgi:hypothetical protein
MHSLKPLALLIACTALLTGCVVTSVYPYYNEKDLTFDPALVGVWVDNGTNSDSESWTFEKLDDKSYKLIVKENEKNQEHEVHLFRLKGNLFLDLLPIADKECKGEFIPPHYLLRVASIQPTLKLRLLNPKWLADLLKENPRALRHIESGTDKDVLLTADTSELQKFILKNLKTADAWSEDTVELKRK